MAFYPNMVWVASVLVIKKLGCDFEKHWEPVLHCSAFEIFSHFKHTWGMYNCTWGMYVVAGSGRALTLGKRV